MLGERKQLRAARGNWEAIRDLRVREAELEASIDLRRLEEDRKVIEVQKVGVEREIVTMGHSEASLRAHQILARRWGGLALLAAGIAVLSAWWTVNWFLSLGWEKVLLAVTLFVLPLIGWAGFLTFAGEALRDWDLRKVFAGLSLVIVLASATAVATLGGARMLGVGLQEEQRQVQQFEIEGEAAATPQRSERERVERAKRLLNALTMVAVILMSIAGELAAGLAYHEYSKHRLLVRTAMPFYGRRAGLAQALAINAATQEAVRKRPEILHAQLTVQGLEGEAEAALAAEAEERRTRAFGPTMRWIAVGFAGLLALLIGAAVAFGESERPELTVVILDLSDSVGVEEFSANRNVSTTLRHRRLAFTVAPGLRPRHRRP